MPALAGRLLAVLLVAALGAGLAPVLLASSAGAAPDERPAAKVRLLRLLSADEVTIAPDRRGPRGTATLRYRLSRPAKVNLVLRGSGNHVLDVYRPGRQAKGRHVFRWRGAQSGVGRLPDGRYALELRARRVGAPASATATRSVLVTIDTMSPHLQVQLNRSVVYPQTPLFADRILVRAELDDGDKAYASIRRYDGTLVRDLHPVVAACDGQASVDWGACGVASWDGRTEDGDIAPTGTYRLRVITGDKAGNQSVSEQEVTVSAVPLVERTRSVTIPAANLSHSSADCYYPGGPQGCGEDTCGPATSQRFPGGLSFGVCQSYFGPTTARAIYGGSINGYSGETGHERYQISATGGPAAGSAGTARLSVGDQSVLMQGDGTFALPEVTVSGGPTSTEFWLDWAVRATGSDAYDVASFSITFVDFVPATPATA